MNYQVSDSLVSTFAFRFKLCRCIMDLESAILCDLRNRVLSNAPVLRDTASCISEVGLALFTTLLFVRQNTS